MSTFCTSTAERLRCRRRKQGRMFSEIKDGKEMKRVSSLFNSCVCYNKERRQDLYTLVLLGCYEAVTRVTELHSTRITTMPL